MMDARRPDQGPLLLLQRVGRRPGPAPLLGRLVSQRHRREVAASPFPAAWSSSGSLPHRPGGSGESRAPGPCGSASARVCAPLARQGEARGGSFCEPRRLNVHPLFLPAEGSLQDVDLLVFAERKGSHQ